MENRNLKALHDELSVLTTEKEKKRKQLCSTKAKYRRLDLKVGCNFQGIDHASIDIVRTTDIWIFE